VLSRILKKPRDSTANVLASALLILLLSWPFAAIAATNTANDAGGGSVSLTSSGPVTVNSVKLALVKQARDLSGTVLPNGTNVPAGQTIYFVLYIDNSTTVQASNLTIQDLINLTQFSYVAGSLQTTTVASGSSNAAIWAGTWTALTDAVGGPDDIASRLANTDATHDRITVGNTTGLSPAQANQPLNIAAGQLTAVRFRVVVQ